MRLDLTSAETEELRDALKSCMEELRVEIAHTDSYDYRQRLKTRRALFGRLVAKLDADESTATAGDSVRREDAATHPLTPIR